MKHRNSHIQRVSIMTLFMVLSFWCYNSVNRTVYAFASVESLEEMDSLYVRVNHESPYVIRDSIRITTYRPTIEECWGNPLITASMAEIDTVKLNEGTLRWCAVSRDLLQHLNYGDEIEVFISEGHKFNGKWIVQDTMNKRWTNCVDLLISHNIKGGKWNGSITHRRM